MPAGYGGVGREDRARAGGLDSLVEGEPFVLGELTDPLEAEEAGVALVGVEDLGRRCSGDAAVGADGAYATDPQQHLLQEPVLGATAVEPVGDLALGRGVALGVGVEQEQGHAADLRLPDLGVQGAAARQADLDGQRAAVGVAQEADRQVVGIQDRVVLLLPALGVEGLLEVAGAIEQADAQDRHAEVAGRLEVVAREDAETTGVLRQHVRDAVLRAEVGDRRRSLGAERLVPPVLLQVALEVGVGLAEAPREVIVRGELAQPLGPHLTEQPGRVVADPLPDHRVDAREEVTRGGVPRPTQVGDELAEPGERLGQDGTDGEPADRAHGRRP